MAVLNILDFIVFSQFSNDADIYAVSVDVEHAIKTKDFSFLFELISPELILV